jgi:DNA-binding transcriptional MerR regulator
MEVAMERVALRVSEVAARAGVHRETLRYYERRGKWAQGLGFTLREIGELARIPSDHVRGHATRVRAQAGAKIREIDAKIGQLQSMKRRLRAMTLCRCNGNCPIVAQAAAGEWRRR